jgi:hypothetical protein
LKEIPLSRGYIAIIDDEDFDLVSQYKWFAVKNRHVVYAYTTNKTNKKPVFLRMHSLILNAQPGQQVDHINGNGLDNRRCNLRFASNSKNQMNRFYISGVSKYKGVSKDGRSKSRPWKAAIQKDKKRYYLGTFSTEIEAAKAYNEAAKILFGEFARLNDII